MNHLILSLLCVISIETFSKSNFLIQLQSIIEIIRKVFKVISSSKVSDHWKEVVIPHYALSMMRHSLKVLLTLIAIIAFFLMPSLFLEGFIDFLISFMGIIESILFAFLYIKLKSFFVSQ
tara:strand:- start:1298 stop:1657 length:360 start_codon:yes stop_codon:yes gene_type:complete